MTSAPPGFAMKDDKLQVFQSVHSFRSRHTAHCFNQILDIPLPVLEEFNWVVMVFFMPFVEMALEVGCFHSIICESLAPTHHQPTRIPVLDNLHHTSGLFSLLLQP
jgi:hypothetical protein